MQFNIQPFPEAAPGLPAPLPAELATAVIPWANVDYRRYDFGEVLVQEYQGRSFSILQHIITTHQPIHISFGFSSERANLIFAMEGHVSCKMNNGARYQLKEQEAGLFLLPAGSNTAQLNPGRFRSLHIAFEQSLLAELAEDAAPFRRILQSAARRHLPKPVPVSHHLMAVVQKLLQAGKQEGLLQLKLKSALLELVHAYIQELKAQKSVAALPGQLHKDKMVAIRQKIVQHPHIQEAKLEKLARQHYLNKGTISKSFFQVFGIYLADFVLAEVMQKALSELVNTEKPIADLADELGYSNSSNFSRAFSEYYKQTPQQVRKQQRLA